MKKRRLLTPIAVLYITENVTYDWFKMDFNY